MAARRRSSDTDRVSEVPQLVSVAMDDSLNFHASLLRSPDIQYIVSLLDESCFQVVGTANFGVPMPLCELDAILQLQIRHESIRCRELAVRIIRFIILCCHYYNGHAILVHSIRQIQRTFSGANKERLESALARLYRSIDSSQNAYHVVEHIGHLDMPTGAYVKQLRQAYNACERAGITVSAEARSMYPTLCSYNHLYRPPKYTSPACVRLYADGIRHLTMRDNAPLRIMTAERRTRDPVEAVNDLMFALSLTNLILMHQDELSVLKKWLLATLNEMCAQLYVAYLQVPSTSALYVSILNEVTNLIDTDLHEDGNQLCFAAVTEALLRFLRALYSSGVYINVDLFRFSAFSVMISGHNILNEAEEERDLELDPTSPYTDARYMVKNPFGQRNLFRCPDNLVKHLRDDFIESDPVQIMMTDWENNVATFDYYKLDYMKTLMVEGAAKQLKMLPTQMAEYLDRACSAARVVDRPHALEESMFANVRVRILPTPERRRDVRRTRPFRRDSDTRPYRRPTGPRNVDPTDDLSSQLNTMDIVTDYVSD
uniref:Tegument protein UL35 n=1 Tax=Hipposideros bat herpesvirus TaxID=3141919 RepID=A0AAU7E238_9VIRU